MQENRREISILKRRILDFLEKIGVSKYECYKSTGITNGVLSQPNGMSEDNLLKFLSYYSTINHTWLLTGRGEMLIGEQPSVSVTQPANDTLLYNMYKEKEAKVEALLVENATLKERLRIQEEKDLGFQKEVQPTGIQKASTGSVHLRNKGVAGSESAQFVEQL